MQIILQVGKLRHGKLKSHPSEWQCSGSSAAALSTASQVGSGSKGTGAVGTAGHGVWADSAVTQLRETFKQPKNPAAKAFVTLRVSKQPRQGRGPVGEALASFVSSCPLPML